MIQAIAIAFIVVTGVVVIVGIICRTMLLESGKVGAKLGKHENPAVQAARDNLEITRLSAKRDALDFERDRILDARHSGVQELPEGTAERIEEPNIKKVSGEVVDKKKSSLKDRGYQW